MKGWILSTPAADTKLPVTAEQAKAIGIEIVNVNDIDVLVSNESNGTIRVAGEAREIPDYVLAAFVGDGGYKPIAVLNQFESLGVICINKYSSIGISKDKIHTSQILAANSIPIAKTLYIEKDKISFDYIEEQFSYPLVIKIIDGTQGAGVFLASDREVAKEIVEKLDPSAEILFQEYIAASHGKDIRVTTFCGKIIKVMGRESCSGDFRSNISLGGMEVNVPKTPAMEGLAKKIYDVTGIELCGVDLLPNGDDSYIVCELNSMPGGLNPTPEYSPMRDMLRGIAMKKAQLPLPLWKINTIMGRAKSEPLHEIAMEMGSLDRYKLVMATLSSCEKVQQMVLRSIIDNSKDSLFGKQHSFEKITGGDSLRELLPISSWEDYSPYVDKMAAGEENILFNGACDSFITTSGTTAKPKMIPESPLGKRAKGFVTSTKLAAIIALMPKLATKGGLLPIVVSSPNSVTEGGIPYACASSMALEQLPPEIAGRIAYPLEIIKAKDQDLYLYLTMRYAIERSDVAIMAGNNATRAVKLIEVGMKYQDMILGDIAEGSISFPATGADRELVDQLSEALEPNPARSSELRKLVASGEPFTPSIYWKEFEIANFWTSASVGVAVEQLRPLLPTSVKFVDTGYGASELKVNIPTMINQQDGLLSTATAFYEFRPMDQEHTLLAHELTVGEEYELIITTYSGLYRYNMHDVVRCTGYMGNTPKVVFVRKSGDISNLAGEKLPGSVLIDAVMESAKRCGMSCRRMQAYPSEENSRYEIFLECDTTDEQFAQMLQEVLKGKHWTYNNICNSGLLKPLTVTFMKKGWQEELYLQLAKGKSISETQIKIPTYIFTKPNSQWYE